MIWRKLFRWFKGDKQDFQRGVVYLDHHNPVIFKKKIDISKLKPIEIDDISERKGRSVD